MVGNLVADGYKGKKYLDLKPGLQRGVLLHRKIDDLTDHAAPTLALKRLLYPYFGRYGGVVTDIYFDHYLARHWEQFHSRPLEHFVQEVYAVLEQHRGDINPESRVFLDRLQQYQWLLAYRDFDKLDVIFRQMSRRTGVETMAGAIDPLQKHNAEIEEGFFKLYPQLIAETRVFLGMDQL